jgi:hypothetical protein
MGEYETDLTYTFPSEDGRETPEIVATVHGARDEAQVAAYLPSNYRVTGSYESETGRRTFVTLAGRDDAGWTFMGYVRPRLASGGMVAVKHA